MSWYDDFMSGEEPRKPVEEDRIIEPIEPVEPSIPSDQSDWYNEMMKISPSKPPIEKPDTSWKGALKEQLRPSPAAETVTQLGWGMASWIPSKLSGLGQIGFQKLNNVIFGSEAKNIKRTPEEREMFRKGVYSPEKIREMAEQSEALWQVLPPPESKEAQFVLEKVGEGLDKVLTPFRIADEYYSKKGYPNLGYAFRFAGEMLFFKAVHGFGVRSTAKIKKVVRKIHKKVSAAEAEKILEEVYEEMGLPKEEVAPKGDELKRVTGAQKKRAHQIQREQGLSKAEYMEIAKRISGETSIKDMNKASAKRFIEELKRGKKKPVEVKEEVKIEPEEEIVEPIVEKPPEVEIPDFKNTQEAYAFGERATSEQVKELQRLRKIQDVKFEELKKADNLQEALNVAVKGQLYDEALQKVKGTEQYKKFEEAKVKVEIKEEKVVPTHGTDIDALGGILEEGLKSGTAMDFSVKREWSGESPIQVEVPKAIKGEYVAHNKYYKLQGEAKATKVIVDLDAYTEVGAEGVLETIKGLKEKHPEVEWKIKGEGPGPEAITPTNIAKLYEKRYNLSSEDALESANIDFETNVIDLYKKATGKSVKNMKDYENLFDYFEETTGVWTVKTEKLEPKPKPEVPSETLKLSISDDIRIAQDMGLYAKIKEMIGEDKKVGEIMKEIKQGAYYKEDLADFGLTEKDIRDSIRAIKAEAGDESAIKQIQTMIEKEKKEVERISEVEEIKEVEPPAEVERVDPLTGRPAGVKEELITAPREIDDIRARWMLEQMPIKNEAGKILKSKVGAMTRMKELGQEGELVKNSKGEGWLVRKERKVSAEERGAEEKEWEEVLKEEEMDLTEEGLGERVDMDILDILDSEKGAITFVKEAKKETKAPKDRNWIAVRLKDDSVFYDESLSTHAQLILKAGIRPVEVKEGGWITSEGYKKTVSDAAKTAARITALLGDERGAITIHRKAAKELKDLVKKGYYTRNRIIKELRERGATDENILKVFPDASVRILNEGKESKWWKPGQDSLALLPRRRLPNKMRAPAITRGEAHMIATMRDMPARLTAEHLSWENAIRTFEKLAPEMKETFYRSVKEGESLAFDRLHDVLKRSKKIRQSVNYSSHKRIGTHAIAMQPDGVAVLAQQGITKIPKLKPKELKAYGDMRAIYEEFFVAVNRARKAAGEKPFPPMKNYFTWIQDMTYLSKVEGVGLFSNWRTIESKMAEIKKVPGFRFAKLRAGPERLRKLNLNPFTVLDTYSKIATNYIEMAPRLAKLNEFLTEKFGMAQNAPHAYNFIRHWLNYQAGKIPAWDIAHPTTRWAMRTLNNNIVYSLLAYNVRSALIQSAALASSYAMLGEYYMAVGLSHMMSPAKWKMAGKKSKVLNTRSPEVGVYEAMAEVKGIMKGVTKVGMFPLTALDSVAARVTWLGAYAKGMKKFKSEQRAINYADDIVTKTQASAARSDIAPIQRTQLGKTVTCLQTFVINHWGFLTKDVLGIKNADIKNPIINKRVIRFILATTAVNAFYEDVLKMNSPNPTPIRAFREKFEETEDYKEAFSAGVKEIAEYIPLVGGRLRYGTDLGGPVVAECLKLIEKGDIEALIKLMGVRGANQFFKMVRAHERGGTDIDIALGRYVEPREKDITAPMDKIKGLTAPIESP